MRYMAEAALRWALREAAERPELPEVRLFGPWDRLVQAVQRLHDIDARHKRGFRLSDRTPTDALLHTIEELTEVGRAATDAERTSEMGDVLGCLIHAAIKAGIDLDDAAESALRKLPQDFPGSEGDNPPVQCAECGWTSRKPEVPTEHEMGCSRRVG